MQNSTTLFRRNSKTSRGRRDSETDYQLPGIYLSTLSRRGWTLNVPDMVSSFTRSQGKLQRRALKDRPGCETVLVFYKVTSEGRECLSLPCLSHQWDLWEQQPKLQLQTLHETEPEMEISMASDLTHQPQALHMDQLLSPPPLLKI